MSDVPASTVPDSEAQPSLVGTTLLERYRIEELVGSGGMGTVYRAEHVHMKKTLAVKVLHREMALVEEIVARFEREAIAAGRIEHPNVARATDFGRLDDGSFYLVMEFVSGQSLGSLLASGPLPVPRALAIAGQVAAGLDAAHAAGVVHRDLKPDNVHLVERDGEPEQVKILDFGIAKVRIEEGGPPSQITRLGSVFGTPEYMAPEQAAGAAVDHRADLYALGLLLHEMITGHAPFQGDVVQVMTQQMTAPPPPLPDRVPPDLRTLCGELLEKEPDRRPQSALEVAQRIDAMLSRREAVANATTELAVDMSAARPRRRWLVPAVAGGSLLLLILVTGVVLLARARQGAEGARLLERGAFSVDVPEIRSPPKPPPRAERPPPAPAPAAAKPSSAPPSKPPKAAPKQKKKKTGPGGIYIPPPSEWF